MIKITVFVLLYFSHFLDHKNVLCRTCLWENIVFEKVYPCESTKIHLLLVNFYFNKKTLSSTELQGNLTMLVPFEDTLTFDLNVMFWGLTGCWLLNSNVYITKKACSALKILGGNEWNSVMKSYNFPDVTCPLSVVEYVTSGLDLKILEDHSFPKIYFYGKYKLVFKVKNIKIKYLAVSLWRLVSYVHGKHQFE